MEATEFKPSPSIGSQSASQATTTVLRIEHSVVNYAAWKAAFDTNPVGRAAAGVLRHRILRATDDPSWVMIDLEFAAAAEATAMLVSLRQLWGRVTGTLILSPEARIVELAESVDY